MRPHSVRLAEHMVALLVTFALSMPALAANREKLWVYETTGGYLDSSPAIVDLDGDGSLDIAMTSIAGPVFALDAFGCDIWRTDLKERISIAPTAADVTGDPGPELLVLAQSGRLYCLEGRTGDIAWLYDVIAGAKLDTVTEYTKRYSPNEGIKHGGTTIVAADINADGLVEVITNTLEGTVVCLNGNGDALWTYEAGERLPCAPAVGDLDGDGTAEVVVGSFEHPAIALSADGSLLWRYSRNPDLPLVGRNFDVTSPVIADLNSDGTSEVITFDQNTMTALNGDGSILWTAIASRRKVDASITVADADMDGSPEIYCVDLTGDVVRVNADGERLWTTNIGQRCRRSFSVADVDGDSVMELVVGAYTGKIHIITPDGTIEDELTIGAGTNATSTVADLLGDGSICVVTPEITGNLSVYHWPATDRNRTILVSGYRGGNSRTASSFVSQAGQRRLITHLSTGTPYERRPVFEVEISNPTRDRLTVELSISDGDGIVAEESKNITRTLGRVRVPYDGARFSGNALFACTVSNSSGIIEKHSFTVPVVPYRSMLDSLNAQNDRIRSLLDEVPYKSGLSERHAYLSNSLPNLSATTDDLSRLSALQLRALRDNLSTLRDNLSAVQTLAENAVRAGTSIAVSAANPWAPFGGVAELSEDRMGPDSLSVEAFQGEVESAALNIWNFSGTAKTLRITMSGLTDGETSVDDAVTVREVVSVATQMSDMASDALPKLNEARTIVVPAWSARQLWLEITTEDLTPGEWSGSVHLKDMDVSANEASAPLTVSVWPVAQSREHIFKLCGWANTAPEGVLEDMFNHGMNVFTDARPVPYQFDGDGNIVSADYSTLDPYMESHAQEGTPMFHSLVRLSGPAEAFSPVWKQAYDAAVKQFTAHIIEIGFGYNDYAYYPVDEPGIEEGRNVARFVKWASITHEADPNIRIYTNPAGVTKEWLAEMMPYADIYAPMHIGSLEDDPRLDEMRADAEEMWTYTCAHNAKHQSPLGYYRAQMWMCFDFGATGGGFYTYTRGSDAFWHMVGGEYSLVYSGENGPVPSKRWEAVRDGTEDYSMLMALKTAAEAPDADVKLARRARELLSGNVVTVGRFCSMDDDGTIPGENGLPGVRKIADRRYATILSVRRQIRDLLVAFAK